MAKDRFKSRTSFILACVGAAVGLGDSLRFPGLCAKYGGGSFMLIYIIALIVIGIPVLNAEIAIGRKLRGGAPKCMASLSKRGEGLGFASCFNSLGVAVLYAGMLGWIIAMLINVVPLCKNSTSMPRAEIGGFFFDGILKNSFSPIVLLCIIVAWAMMFLCLKNGADIIADDIMSVACSYEDHQRDIYAIEDGIVDKYCQVKFNNADKQKNASNKFKAKLRKNKNLKKYAKIIETLYNKD